MLFEPIEYKSANPTQVQCNCAIRAIRATRATRANSCELVRTRATRATRGVSWGPLGSRQIMKQGEWPSFFFNSSPKETSQT